MPSFFSFFQAIFNIFKISCGDASGFSFLSSAYVVIPGPRSRNSQKNYPAAYLSHFNDIILSVFDDIGASSTLSSLTTWLRRPLRNDQLGGTKRRYSVAEPNDAKQGKSRMIWAPCIVQFELRLAQFSPPC